MKVRTEFPKRKLVHATATCLVCDWEDQNYDTAVRHGREHAQRMGHKVMVETGYAQHYIPIQDSVDTGTEARK